MDEMDEKWMKWTGKIEKKMLPLHKIYLKQYLIKTFKV